MKKVVKIISLLSGLLFCFACGGGEPDPEPIDCKDLCFTVVGTGSGSISMEWKTTTVESTMRLENAIEVSRDGRNWHIWDGSRYTAFFPLAVGEKFYIRNTSGTLSKSPTDFFYFTSDAGFSDMWAISGDISSLINYSNEMKDYSFYRLFGKNEHVSDAFQVCDASKLLLPADKLSNGCYEAMFAQCFTLKSSPQLPATQLADSCYKNMFQSCVSLNVYTSENTERTKFFTAPDPSTDSYTDMFWNCGGEASSSEFKVEAGQSYYYENQI